MEQFAAEEVRLPPDQPHDPIGDAALASVIEAREALDEAGFLVNDEKEVQGGTHLRTEDGPILCIWDNGNVSATGKSPELLEDVVADLKGRGQHTRAGGKPKVFVVYGHDVAARDKMEAILRKWDLAPIILDQQASGGATLIEKLERYRRDVVYAVVLATPDDEGHRRGYEEEKKFRARQNVVLELGMMLGYLDRNRIAVVQPNLSDKEWEAPSDMKGIVYLGYDDDIEDVLVPLYKEMLDVGIHISPKNL